MYQSTFGFQLRPFPSAPRHDWFFASESARQACETLTGCVERAAGPAMLIGAPGTGKSLVCQRIAHQLRSTFSVVVLDSARLCTRRAFLQSILFELGLPFRDLSEGELRLNLIDFLQPSEECPNGMLLLVDEAHVMPMRLLEELRMITNLVRDGQPRVRLLLAGNRSLEERFTHPQLESFNQRIAARCYLKPLSVSETGAYIRFHLQKAGGAQSTGIVSDEAIQAVYEMTEGVPRLINQVCDHALLLAAADNKRQVNARLVAESWADIQQLPTPWFTKEEADETDAPSSVIEFGELDAEPASDNQTTAQRPAESSVNQTAEPLEQALDAIDDIDRVVEHAVGKTPQLAKPAKVKTQAAQAKSIQQDRQAPNVESVSSVAKPTVHVELDPAFDFDKPVNPFTEEFAEEQTIDDPYAKDLTDQESMIAANTLDATATSPSESKNQAEPAKVIGKTKVVLTQATAAGRATTIRLQPAVLSESTKADNAGNTGKPTIKLHATNPGSSADDRDIILQSGKAKPALVAATETEPATATEKPKVHREEYTTLFQRMRNG
jgi:type II secretory pathway predicted ATPase ExeA